MHATNDVGLAHPVLPPLKERLQALTESAVAIQGATDSPPRGRIVVVGTLHRQIVAKVVAPIDDLDLVPVPVPAPRQDPGMVFPCVLLRTP